MKRIHNIDTIEKIGEDVKLTGWVDSIRDHGNLVFIDLRDRSSLIQLVIFRKELISAASALAVEDLVEIVGEVQKRPDKLVNADLATGTVEIGVKEIKLVSKAAALPFEINQNTAGINELSRLKYRYLDLRSSRMASNLRVRHEVNLFFRNYFSEHGFWEVETPCLTKGTPEGAREYIVPSRLQPGNFYVLPQSPQQYKQLLMVSGIEKYFQIARCFRDEDQRGDRQPEFTQLDFEMSFVEQADIMDFLEETMVKLIETVTPALKLQQKPFPKITYQESMAKYGTDKPDLRKDKNNPDEMAFCWITEFPLFEIGGADGKMTSAHHPFTRPNSEDLDKLESKTLEVRGESFDLVLNGNELGSGGTRIYEAELQAKIFEILGMTKDEIQQRFGHMLEAFEYSPPPHGGFAIGIDRLLTILQNEKNVREVIAFPKTGDAKDPLMGAPTDMSEEKLAEANIKKIIKKK
jgi:aspartyl-tRNA synthetase